MVGVHFAEVSTPLPLLLPSLHQLDLGQLSSFSVPQGQFWNMERPLVPHGYSPPFATVTTLDHAAWILIATSLGMVYSVIFGYIRIFARQAIGRHMSADDAMLAFSTVGLLSGTTVLAISDVS